MNRLQLAVSGLICATLMSAGSARAQSNDAHLLVGAALNDRPDRIEELVRSGASVDADFMGMTALCMVAAYDDSQHLESARELLKAGADVNRHCGPAQRTPLHDAALDGDIELARLLLAHGAKLDAKTKFGRTPLEFATNPPAPLKPPANSNEMAALLRAGSGAESAQAPTPPSLSKEDARANKVRDDILAAKQKAYEAGEAEIQKSASASASASAVSYGPDFPAVEAVRPEPDRVGLRLGLMALLLLTAAVGGYWVGRRRGLRSPE